MKSNLLKSLLAGAVLVAGVTTASAQAGDGTAASSAYTVCPSATQFKLTTQDYPSDYTYSWTAIATPSGATGAASTAAGSGTDQKGVYTISNASGFAKGNYSYKLEVTSGSGCKTSDTFFVKVIDTAITIALGSGTDGEYCEDIIGSGGEAINLTATTASGTEVIASSAYAWTATGTATVVTPTDANTTTGTVPSTPGTYTFGAKATYKVDVAPSGGCKSGEATTSIIVNPRPAAPSAGISGS